MATTANASLTSNRSTSPTLQPARASAFFIAGTGAVVNWPGSWAWAPWPAMRAIGVRPSASAVEARISTSAAAPSEIEEALAAVIAPSLAKAGFSAGILRRVGLQRLLVVADRGGPAPRRSTSTGAISRPKAPLSTARLARARLSMA